MPSLTKEQQEDCRKRIDLFKEGYEALKKEHQVDFWAAPAFTPGPGGLFAVSVAGDFVDLKYAAPSPLSGKA